MNYDNIKNYAEKYAVPIMRPETSKLICNFVKTETPKNILEIGTAIGYSGILMLENSSAKLTTIEHNKEYIKQAKLNFKKHKLKKRVKIIDGDCLVALANMASKNRYRNSFDLIFLDGPKAQYDKMLELIILLLKNNGTLIVDDVLFHKNLSENGTVSRRFKTIESRLNKFIENCKNHPKFSKFDIKNIEDGIIFAKKGTKWAKEKLNF